MDRRVFIQAASGAAALVAMPAIVRAANGWQPKQYPFSLGVASGYPRPGGFVLWTRLAPAPLTAFNAWQFTSANAYSPASL